MPKYVVLMAGATPGTARAIAATADPRVVEPVLRALQKGARSDQAIRDWAAGSRANGEIAIYG